MQPPCGRLCAVYARDRQDREDLFQNIVLAIWKALPAFRGDAAERTWVYSIAHNVALTWQARERQWQHRRRGLEEAPQVFQNPGNERRMQLEAVIPQLTPVDRQLVILWLEGFTTAQIAEATGMRPGTVGVRLTRIQQTLTQTLESSERNNG
jgi:RNA polymerase sigma-70 factor (ECF subfamily)